MSTSPVAFYISGHGHGHARRCAEVARHWLQLEPNLHLWIRTTAPAEIFSGLPRTNVSPASPFLDAGAIETDVLTIDPAATLQHLRKVLRNSSNTIAHEIAWLQSQHIRFLVADIPFLAGEIARTARLPVIGLSNFTWDWIFEPFLSDSPDGPQIIEQIRLGYRNFQHLLKLPLGPPNPLFPSQTIVPFIAQKSPNSRGQILDRLHSALPHAAPIVCVSLRSGVSESLLATTALRNPDLIFFYPGRAQSNLPANTRSFSEWPELSFADFLKASDAVVAKLGFGILSDAIAASTRLLFPIRENFREDLYSQQEAKTFLTMRPIPKSDFLLGNWRPHLLPLLSIPPSTTPASTNGAELAATLLARMFT